MNRRILSETSPPKSLKRGLLHRYGARMNKRKLKFPEKCEELAELVGIMLGNGNMFSDKRPGVSLR